MNVICTFRLHTNKLVATALVALAFLLGSGSSHGQLAKPASELVITGVEKLPDGKTRKKAGSDTEQGSGSHRQLPDGSWVETNPRIEVSADGQQGLVRNLQYQVVFAANLATPNALDISLPDRARLTGHFLGLFYFDGERSVLIAELKDVFGEIGGAEQNELLFRDALTDFAVDVQYVVERGRLSQNILLRQQLPSPMDYGLTEKAALTVLTEWTAFPEVQRQSRVRGDAVDALPDEHISLGAMQFAEGRALSIGGDAAGKLNRIRHSWEVFDGGRNCLVEQIPWKEVEPELRALPPASAGALKRWKSGRIEGQARNVAKPSLLPEKRVVRASTGTMQMARAAAPRRPGYLLDFELVMRQAKETAGTAARDLRLVDSDGDGVSDFIEMRQGRNPHRAAFADTNGLVNLRIFTPLK